MRGGRFLLWILVAAPVAAGAADEVNVLQMKLGECYADTAIGDDTADAQAKLADRIVAEGLSVRATEEAVSLINSNGTVPDKPKRQPVPQPEYLTQAADSLADAWDTKVSVTMGKRKGKIVVEFGDKDDFERIMGPVSYTHLPSPRDS